MRTATARFCTAAIAAAAFAPVAALTPATASASAATSRSGGPTRVQIQRAVTRATRSSYLWATVNVCTRQRPGGVIGVRGEMPSLGFDATESMSIQLRRYDPSMRAFVDVSGATARRTEALGTVRSGVRQDGAEFPFRSDTPMLDARVTFTWTRDGRRLAQVSRTTSAGHHSAAYGQPKGYSSASCRL